MNQLRDLAAYLERPANTNANELVFIASDFGENSAKVQNNDEPVLQPFGLNELSWLGLDIETVQKTSKSDDDLLNMIEQSLDAEDGVSSSLINRLTGSMPDLINFDDSKVITQDVNKSVSLPSLSFLDDVMVNSLEIENMIAFFDGLKFADIPNMNDQASASQIEQNLSIDGSANNLNNNIDFKLPSFVNISNQENQTNRPSTKCLNTLRRQLKF